MTIAPPSLISSCVCSYSISQIWDHEYPDTYECDRMITTAQISYTDIFIFGSPLFFCLSPPSSQKSSEYQQTCDTPVSPQFAYSSVSSVTQEWSHFYTELPRYRCKKWPHHYDPLFVYTDPKHLADMLPPSVGTFLVLGSLDLHSWAMVMVRCSWDYWLGFRGKVGRRLR